MGEKTDELYEKYLNKQLDIIFNRDKSIPVLVCINGKYNYEAADGSYLSDIWFDKANKFEDEYAVVEYDGKQYFIDKNGHPLAKDLFEEVQNFSEGFAVVKLCDRKYNFIDKYGKLIGKRWFKDAKNFTKDGLALVQTEDGRYNYVKTNGELLLNKGYENAVPFVNGFAVVKRGDIYTYIDVTGKPIGATNWYAEAYDFSDNGVARVKNNNKFFFIDTKGNPINDQRYIDATNFVNDRAIVKLDENQQGVIDGKGNLISGELYNYIKESYYDYVYVIKKSKCNFLNIYSGQLAGEWKRISDYAGDVYENFLIISRTFMPDTAICTTKDLNGYIVKKGLKEYKCLKGNDSFAVNAEPIRMYGDRYVLCMYYHKYNERLKLYDKVTKEYEELGTCFESFFDENFIICYKNSYEHILSNVDKIYFMYNNQKIDVTKYYKKYLEKGKALHITPGIKILSKNEYFILHEKEIKDDFKNDKKLEEEAKKQKAIEQENKDVLSAKEANEDREKKQKEEWENAVEGLKKSLETLEKLEKEKGLCLKIKVSNLLINVGDHKEINPFYINEIGLRHIDLSGENFKNVKLAGIDFRNCNIHFNPQDVYPHNSPDLRDCNFEGIHIPTFADFTGVDIRGTKFSSNNDPRTSDFMNSFFRGAIYDETTIYDGIPLTDLIVKNEDTSSIGTK